MRNTFLALACYVVFPIVLAGCYESLTNIGTADKVVFDAALLGKYAAVDPASGTLTLERGREPKTYYYRQYDDDGGLLSQGTLWVVNLGEATCYQFSVDGYATADGRPLYFIGRLGIDGTPGAKTLTGYAFKSADTILSDPLVKTEAYERVKNGERTKGRALSMPSEKLQTYLAQRAAAMTEPTLKFRQTVPGR